MSKVYFIPIEKIKSLSESASILLDHFLKEEKIKLQKNLFLKIHPGAIGNTAYIKPENHFGIIKLLEGKGISPLYVETCMASEKSSGKLNEFKKHGFNNIPIVIADGNNGTDDLEIKIPKAKHLKYSLIAKKLAEQKQVLVLSHFKGHSMAGFGGAIKMLGIGFASGRGKALIHGIKDHFDPGDKVDWEHANLPGISKKWVQNWNPKVVSSGETFNERVAESAYAAAHGKKHIYLTFAVDIVNNCDCDGKALVPVYKDVGIFISSDPVAIDKAVFDILESREGEKPFEGDEIFLYSDYIGLGSSKYELVNIV